MGKRIPVEEQNRLSAAADHAMDPHLGFARLYIERPEAFEHGNSSAKHVCSINLPFFPAEINGKSARALRSKPRRIFDP